MTYWVVLRVQKWSSIEADGVRIGAPQMADGRDIVPVGWMPVFTTEREALDIAGDPSLVISVEPVEVAQS